jgi:hypothetical protein
MLTQRLSLTNQDARTVSSTKLHNLGSVMETADGRVYRYALSGASVLAAGLCNNGVAKVTNHTINSVATAAALGDRSVNITLAGATATTAGQYDDGYLHVIDSTGVGCSYRIAGTPVIAASGTGRIQLAEGIATALTTSSKVALVPSPWAGSVVLNNSVSLFCNGSNNVSVAAASYYWSQTGGIASILSDGIIAKNAEAINSDAVNGAVETRVDATVTRGVGFAVEATVDQKYYPIFLTLE